MAAKRLRKRAVTRVSVLFNEPKLLKFYQRDGFAVVSHGFSALQRAEIAEIAPQTQSAPYSPKRFSALQRAEIAEISTAPQMNVSSSIVSVLFNEPKLLKCRAASDHPPHCASFSALQRAEIAEIV